MAQQVDRFGLRRLKAVVGGVRTYSYDGGRNWHTSARMARKLAGLS